MPVKLNRLTYLFREFAIFGAKRIQLNDASIVWPLNNCAYASSGAMDGLPVLGSTFNFSNQRHYH